MTDRLSRRLPALGDDRGSLAMAMMAVLVGAMLGGLMLPMVISQNRSTRFDMARVRNLQAAQAGVNVVLGKIRASTKSTNGVVGGDVGKLPCTASSPITGLANGTGTGTYSVSVRYFTRKPSDGGAPMTCVSGYGTFDPATGTAAPRYAVITSDGTDGSVDNGRAKRTIESTYAFQTDDTNIAGGVIRLYPQSTSQWCMDAGAAVPVAPASVVLRTCSVSIPPLAQQVFAYRRDLSIQLVSSVTPALPKGLCIDTSGAHVVDAGIVLNTCAIANPEDDAECPLITRCSPYTQQWSSDGSAHLRDARSDQSDTATLCIDAAAQSDGTPLHLVSCAGSVQDTRQTWVPSPSVGAGMAGAANDQLVNFRQFATCLDVTGQQPAADYLILYTCKQNPDPTQIRWNQKFTPAPVLATGPTNVLLRTTDPDSVSYCLMSPGTDGGYVRVTAPCPASAAVGSPYTWRMYQEQDAGGNALPYALKYTVVDSSGRCLATGPSGDLHNSQYLKAVVSACDGSTGQKWNANATVDAARISKIHETP